MKLILNKLTLFNMTIFYMSTLATQLVILEITFFYFSIVFNFYTFACELKILSLSKKSPICFKLYLFSLCVLIWFIPCRLFKLKQLSISPRFQIHYQSLFLFIIHFWINRLNHTPKVLFFRL